MKVIYFRPLLDFPALAAKLHLQHSTQNQRSNLKIASTVNQRQRSKLSAGMEKVMAQFAEVMVCLARIEAKVDQLTKGSSINLST